MTADEVEPKAATVIGGWLEVDLDAQPIEGTLSPPGGSPSTFVGWLGLTAALEGLRGASQERERAE